MPKFIDITGQKFGRLQVIEIVGTDHLGKAQWRCICRCGNETVVAGVNLRSGNTKSCGCKLAEQHKAFVRTHYSNWVDPGDPPSVEDLDDLIKG
jgi:hypothetical protein